MSHRFQAARKDRQALLSTIQRLDLTLLIDAQNNRMIGRVEIQANHIVKLFLELGVIRNLERLRSMGLQVVLPPDSMDDRTRNP